MIDKKNKRRYNLHYKLRKNSEFVLNSKHREILIPAGKEQEVKKNRYAMILADEFKYSLQITIQ